MKKKVLFICTHNSVRSQMAEGFLRYFYGGYCDVYSAGTKPSGVNPFAIRAMQETGVNISGHKSKSVTEFLKKEFDFIVVVCNDAHCPSFPGKGRVKHKAFPDPSTFEGSDERKFDEFRKVRDEIKNWIDRFFSTIFSEK